MVTTKRAKACTLAELAALPRWVAWREDQIEANDGSKKRTKVPYDPHTRYKARIPTEPATWGTREQAERRCRSLLRRDDKGGVGIVLGELDDGSMLMGIDLDSCIADNSIAPWAVEVIERFDSYAEVSPSQQGVKLFFLVAANDVDAVIRLLGDKTRRTFAGGEHREIAIDWGRFYAVTDDILDNKTPATLRTVERGDVRWFLESAGPRYKRLHGVEDSKRQHGQRAGRDESGSGYGCRFMAERKAKGDNSFARACDAILADRGEAGEWARRVDDRQLRRAWDATDDRGRLRDKRGRQRDNRGNSEKQLDVVCVADVPMQPVDWVWYLRLARGKLTIISGDPGAGKSQIGFDAAARVTQRRGTWPDGGEPAPSGSVVILSAEDAIDDTIRPRLEAAGADVRRVHIVQAVLDVDENRERTFNLQRDLEQLEQKIAKIGDVILVIIDPISSYMGEGIEGNAMTSVRPVLEAVARMAERCHVAVLLIHHPPKHADGKAMYAFSGSLAFVAAARIAFLVVEEQESERYLLLAVKNNLGPKAGGLGYYIKGTYVGREQPSGPIKTSYIEWDDASVSISADEALRGPQQPSKLERAKEVLRELLADGPRDSREIIDLAKAVDIGERTLRDAKDELGVRSRKTGYQGSSEWLLSAEQDTKANGKR
jgi:hypothetical protein